MDIYVEALLLRMLLEGLLILLCLHGKLWAVLFLIKGGLCVYRGGPVHFLSMLPIGDESQLLSHLWPEQDHHREGQNLYGALLIVVEECAGLLEAGSFYIFLY